MIITRTSPFSRIPASLDLPITEDQFDLWKTGVPIQYAMSNLNADEREFIMTGILPEEFPA